MSYIKHVGIALDQLANALAGGAPDETVSARAWRLGVMRESTAWAAIAALLDFVLGQGHCQSAYLSEQSRKGEAREYKA